MDFEKVYSAYEELKENLLQKHDVIIKKNVEELSRLDEITYVIIDKIKKFNLDKEPNDFTLEQKQNLKSLGLEIKKIENNNEILIKHSLNVINNLLSGILNIVQSDKNVYNAQGIECTPDESLDISSITEEA